MAELGTIVIFTILESYNFHILNYSNEWLCRLSHTTHSVMRLCALLCMRVRVYVCPREQTKGVINNSSFNLNEMASCPHRNSFCCCCIVSLFLIPNSPRLNAKQKNTPIACRREFGTGAAAERKWEKTAQKNCITQKARKGSLTSGFSLIRVPLFVRSPFLSARKLQVCCCILWCESFSLYFLCFSLPAAAIVIDDRRLGMFMTEWISVDYRDNCEMVDLWWLLSVVDQFKVVAHSLLQSNHKKSKFDRRWSTTFSHFSLLCVLVFPLSCRAMKNLWKRNAILTWFHLSSFPCCLSSHWSVYWFLCMYTRTAWDQVENFKSLFLLFVDSINYGYQNKNRERDFRDFHGFGLGLIVGKLYICSLEVLCYSLSLPEKSPQTTRSKGLLIQSEIGREGKVL